MHERKLATIPAEATSLQQENLDEGHVILRPSQGRTRENIKQNHYRKHDSQIQTVIVNMVLKKHS